MGKLDLETIIRNSKKKFEKTWVETSGLLPRNTKLILHRKGSLHPFRETIQQCREILSGMGFKEIENKTILTDEDVTKQYGPEAPVILDRAFYLAKLPRPDIGLSKEKINHIEKITGKFDYDLLQEILRDYKKGKIEGDDFVEELVIKLNIKTEQATEIISKVFPEFKKLTPQSTNLTLRTHMTATWFHTLEAIQVQMPFPIALFSIGPRYRNEQREDKGHLRVHHSTSIVIMDPEMSLEAGKIIVKDMLKKFNFEDVRFEVKKGTSKYYAKDQEEEIFAKLGKEWFEIGDIGMYSPIALAYFNIEYPVFNAGFGVERLVMILKGYFDIRDMLYPQFRRINFTDKYIAESLTFINEPGTERGEKIARAIEATARKYRNEIAPCEFIAFEDDQVIVKLVEKEEGKKLIGPAAFNEVYFKDCNILSQLEGKENKAVTSYIKSISLGIAAQIEDSINKGEDRGFFQVKIIRSLADINLQLPLKVYNYITGEHKKVYIGGPVFLGVEYSILNIQQRKGKK